MTKNDNSIYFKDWTMKKLKQQAEVLDDLINGKNACYGTKDLIMFDGILEELENRGVDINSQITFN